MDWTGIRFPQSKLSSVNPSTHLPHKGGQNKLETKEPNTSKTTAKCTKIKDASERGRRRRRKNAHSMACAHTYALGSLLRKALVAAAVDTVESTTASVDYVDREIECVVDDDVAMRVFARRPIYNKQLYWRAILTYNLVSNNDVDGTVNAKKNSTKRVGVQENFFFGFNLVDFLEGNAKVTN
ncbi:hypothetical protein CBL_10792 [Carabus blaptoides fortunei]